MKLPKSGLSIWGYVAVILFLVLFTWGFLANKAEAADLTIGLGYGAVNTADSAEQELGLQLDEGKWYIAGARIGDSGNDANSRGYEWKKNWRVRAGRQVFFRKNKTWRPWMRFGMAYFDNSPPTVGDKLTYDLGAGVEWNRVISVGWAHNSTAGRSHPNAGVDYVLFTMILPLN